MVFPGRWPPDRRTKRCPGRPGRIWNGMPFMSPFVQGPRMVWLHHVHGRCGRCRCPNGSPSSSRARGVAEFYRPPRRTLSGRRRSSCDWLRCRTGHRRRPGVDPLLVPAGAKRSSRPCSPSGASFREGLPQLVGVMAREHVPDARLVIVGGATSGSGSSPDRATRHGLHPSRKPRVELSICTDRRGARLDVGARGLGHDTEAAASGTHRVAARIASLVQPRTAGRAFSRSDKPRCRARGVLTDAPPNSSQRSTSGGADLEITAIEPACLLTTQSPSGRP
jgi:hypothetical protein